jgi:hypothetical protein
MLNYRCAMGCLCINCRPWQKFSPIDLWVAVERSDLKYLLEKINHFPDSIEIRVTVASQESHDKNDILGLAREMQNIEQGGTVVFGVYRKLRVR